MLGIDDINRLEQENRELRAYRDVNEDFKKAWEELKQENENCKNAMLILAEGLNKRQIALEKIKKYAKERCRQKILDIVDEVLKDEMGS